MITAQYDGTGALRGFSKITRDITDRRAAEIALRTAREEAERASRAKSEFLSRMSHELRTPLNSILGFAQLLDMDAAKTQKAQVGHILRAGQHLLTLINEVLDIAKIEAGGLALNIAPIPLTQVLQEALTLVSPMATDAAIQLQPLPPLAADIGIVADRQRLTQVLLNLLSNAIKYNRREGQVSIEVTVDGPRIGVAVCDSGTDMAAGHLEQLFTPFERLGADPNVEGSGLGPGAEQKPAGANGRPADRAKPGRYRLTLYPGAAVRAPAGLTAQGAYGDRQRVEAPCPRRLPGCRATCCASKTTSPAWR